MDKALSASARRRLPGRPGVQDVDVCRACDALLMEGLWPSYERIRAKVGHGSPNTVNPIRNEWWKRLGGRLKTNPAGLPRIPESLSNVLELLLIQMEEVARQRIVSETGTKTQSLDQRQSDLEVRAKVLHLREAELQSQLRERSQSLDVVQSQVSSLATLLQQANEAKASSERRMAALEAELADLRQRIPRMLARAVVAHRRRQISPSSQKSVKKPRKARPRIAARGKQSAASKHSKKPKRSRRPSTGRRGRLVGDPRFEPHGATRRMSYLR